ncbi:ATP-binding cassette domain-containing protein [Pseudovibrio exalbescens]|uniref:oligopeptide/dipeptide ABC transporter ATP-binding protein n=1 Tax=Pseudovibrio exalbescens TaxID=197461 RepID=UPI00236506FD|nr:oligopeptide/dipeptide ABC transporter ATP-binding protein [Pseudovibrio exalbescens]MDD7911575.1 ATP-binding cassette domain-containing protein [Pseudovibrio exalbescens]
MPMFEINNLSVAFNTDEGTVNAVSDLSLSIDKGRSLAIVGESGSGKSQTAFAALGLLARNGKATGSVRFDGAELLNAPLKTLNQVRSTGISMVFQDPMTSLNPFMRVSDQMAEVLIHHKGLSKKDALRQSVEMLDAVHIPDAKARLHYYPHEFSGGMRQRVMIAMSLLCKPKLLIADEPTTALDVTVQAQIMDLFGELRREFGMAVILITHDLGVVAGFCDEVLVMYGGRVMEQGPVDAMFDSPSHPYTRGLLQAIPRVDQLSPTLKTIPGSPPNLLSQPAGCPFAPRCSEVQPLCETTRPALEAFAEGRLRACTRPVLELAS